MHARTILLVAATAPFVASIATFAATPPARPPDATRPGPSNSTVTKHLAKPAVAARLGMPSDVLAPGLWVYRDVRTDYRQANARGCDTLLVFFAGDRVQEMRMVNGEQLT